MSCSLILSFVFVFFLLYPAGYISSIYECIHKQTLQCHGFCTLQGINKYLQGIVGDNNTPNVFMSKFTASVNLCFIASGHHFADERVSYSEVLKMERLSQFSRWSQCNHKGSLKIKNGDRKVSVMQKSNSI